MNPTCADCKNWNPDGRCASGTPTAEPWRRRNRVAPGFPSTVLPATGCPDFSALVPAPTPKPTKPRPTKIPLRYRRFSPAGCTSPATAAAAVATEATRVLAPLARSDEGIAEAVARIQNENTAMASLLSEGGAALERAINEKAAAEVARDYALADLRAARRARDDARATLDGAHQVLDRIDAPQGLLADRVLALAVQREEAREDRDRALARVALLESQRDGDRFLVLVMGGVFAAAVVAGLLAAFGFLPTLSVA